MQCMSSWRASACLVEPIHGAEQCEESVFGLGVHLSSSILSEKKVATLREKGFRRGSSELARRSVLLMIMCVCVCVEFWVGENV
jgi:hypothetical protein